MPKLPSISDAEWEVMHVVWERGTATAQEVHEALDRGRRWSPRTVKTLLSRLVKKGALQFEVDGKRYLYRPRVSREQCVRAESRSFADRVLGGSASPLIATFLRESKLSAREIEELRALLDEKARRR
jgi:BlaI family penicillinase repressor